MPSHSINQLGGKNRFGTRPRPEASCLYKTEVVFRGHQADSGMKSLNDVVEMVRTRVRTIRQHTQWGVVPLEAGWTLGGKLQTEENRNDRIRYVAAVSAADSSYRLKGSLQTTLPPRQSRPWRTRPRKLPGRLKPPWVNHRPGPPTNPTGRETGASRRTPSRPRPVAAPGERAQAVKMRRP